MDFCSLCCASHRYASICESIQHGDVGDVGIDSIDLIPSQPENGAQVLIEDLVPALSSVMEHDAHSFKAINHIKQFEVHSVFP
jgi:hypothetical protein